eukprot:4537805-Pyramimonas_sp.AAC.1
MPRRYSSSSQAFDAQASTPTPVEGHKSLDIQIWPGKMAERLAQGIADVRRRLRRPHLANCVRECDVRSVAFPTVASRATEGGD